MTASQHSSPAYVWGDDGLRAVGDIAAPDLHLIRAIDRQKEAVYTNILRHAQGFAAHDMLLWGARGMGKSVLVRAALKHVRAQHQEICLVQLSAGRLNDLPSLFSKLAEDWRRYIVFVDDLGFAPQDLAGPRQLRSMLEGGVEARPDNIRLAVTTNHRVITARIAADSDNLRHERDSSDDELALADRFGLALGFHACSQDDYLAVVNGYAEEYGLAWETLDALEWAKQRGARSGRVAWQYITELAGRAQRAL